MEALLNYSVTQEMGLPTTPRSFWLRLSIKADGIFYWSSSDGGIDLRIDFYGNTLIDLELEEIN